jgi:hypothetical protein
MRLVLTQSFTELLRLVTADRPLAATAARSKCSKAERIGEGPQCQTEAEMWLVASCLRYTVAQTPETELWLRMPS